MDHGLVVVAAASAGACVLLTLLLRSYAAAWVTRRRFRRGAAGQRDARQLLERRGYRVVAEEVPLTGHMVVDGHEVGYEVRLDLVVQRGRRYYGVEVKTGRRAPDPRHRTTRRQLLEYCLLLHADGLLLLDMEARRLVPVSFPHAGSRAKLHWAMTLATAALGAAGGAILATVLG
jgi:hypothetical protein